MMTTATAAIFVIVMIMVMIAVRVIMAAIGVVFVRRTATLHAAEDDEEKSGEQDKSEDDEHFHDCFMFWSNSRSETNPCRARDESTGFPA